MTDKQPLNGANRAANRPLPKQRRVWIAGLAALGVMAGLFLFSSSSSSSQQIGWTNYPAAVGALAVDKQGRVWATCQYYCTNNNNIMMYSDGIEPVEAPLPGELAEDRGMSALAIDYQDRIWVGSWNGAVGVWDSNNQWKIFTPENFASENSERVLDIVVDKQGRAWVRSNVGLGVIDPAENGTTYSFTNSGLPDNNVSAIAMDEDGQLWVENAFAIKALEPDGHWTTIYQDIYEINFDATDVVYGSAFAIDRQGQAWRGTYEGVVVFRPDGTRQSYTLGDPRVVNYINSIVIDNQDGVWVGARQGLFRFDPDAGWTTYNSQNSSLSGDGVKALAIDGQGRVWIGTDDGLSVLDVDAALSPKNLQANIISWSAIIPSAVLGLLLVIGLIFAFTRPGALRAITIRDFFIGFLGWFAINLIFWGGVNAFIQSLGSGGGIVIVFCLWIPPAYNIALLVVSYRKRRWIAIGALSAFIANSIGLMLSAPPVTDPYYHSPIFEIVLMLPFMLRNVVMGF